MSAPIRIGTRDSKLALWQANLAKELLEKEGYECVLVPVKSDGDINLTTPLYEMGVQGIFTKALDIALLEGTIDVAVHSMKDVPVVQAKGLTEAAVLPRASHTDVLVFNKPIDTIETDTWVIGSSSLRRRAQWLYRYPTHTINPIRGNVQTRLRKLQEGEYDAVIFAEAGLDRLELKPQNYIVLDWMLPAPAQGAILLSCRADDTDTLNKCSALNDEVTYKCVTAERMFLRRLEAGCSAPVGALAVAYEENGGEYIRLQGNILNTTGDIELSTSMSVSASEYKELGVISADVLIGKGALNLK